MNNETKFSVGDVIEWGGVIGKITYIPDDNSKNMNVFFEMNGYNQRLCFFYPDGRDCDWHTEPSLKLISKAKKKRKVKLYAHILMDSLSNPSAVSQIYYSCVDRPLPSWVRVPELDKEVEIEE